MSFDYGGGGDAHALAPPPAGGPAPRGLQAPPLAAMSPALSVSLGA